MQRERDEMTNRLATLQAENTQLKSGQNTAELLKLRGEVGRLRTEARISALLTDQQLLRDYAGQRSAAALTSAGHPAKFTAWVTS